MLLFRARPTESIDGGGAHILRATLPPAPTLGPYSLLELPGCYVPPLSLLSIIRLSPFPDQIPIALRLRYLPEDDPRAYDLLRALPSPLDPRLWATLVQIYDNLPPSYQSYAIPLSDIHLPLLQRVPPTPHFSLLTILELPGCPDLEDDTILTLKLMHALTAFDASSTRLSPYAFKVLAGTLVCSDDSLPRLRGPWALRILMLCHCTQIDNTVFPHLAKFPLLSVLDVRGTRCTPNASSSASYRPASNPRLYHPTPLSEALSILQDTPNFHSSQNMFTLHIKTLHHRQTAPRKPSSVAPQNTFVVFPSTSGKIIIGNADTLVAQNDARADALRHERNKEAFYLKHPEATVARRYLDCSWFHADSDCEANSDDGERDHSNDIQSEEDESEDDYEPMHNTSSHRSSSHDDQPSSNSALASCQPSESDSTTEKIHFGAPSMLLAPPSSPGISQRPLVPSIPTPSLSGATATDTRSIDPHSPVRHSTLGNSHLATTLGSATRQGTLSSRVMASSWVGQSVSGGSRSTARVGHGHPRWPENHLRTSLQEQSKSLPVARRQITRLALPDRTPSILTTNTPTSPLPEAPSPLPPPPSPRVDWRSTVAADEARIDASRQAAASFYSLPSNTKLINDSYSADYYRTPTKPSGKFDDLLMLYRDPPPWSELEKVRPLESVGSRAKPPASTLAVVDRTKMYELMVKKPASELGMKKMKVQSPDEPPRAVVMSSSRNPFRKQPTMAPAAAQVSYTPKTDIGVLPMTGSRDSEARRKKPLIPISSVKVPSLPKELRTQLARDSNEVSRSTSRPSLGRGIKKATGDGDTPGTSKKSDSSACSLPVMLKRSVSSSELRGSKVGGMKPSTNLPSGKSVVKQKSRQEVGTAKFDWNGWGARKK